MAIRFHQGPFPLPLRNPPHEHNLEIMLPLHPLTETDPNLEEIQNILDYINEIWDTTNLHSHALPF